MFAFDDNSTCQHFKRVFIPFITLYKAYWYVNYLCHYNLKSKLLIGFLQQATCKFVVMSEVGFKPRGKFRVPTISF